MDISYRANQLYIPDGAHVLVHIASEPEVAKRRHSSRAAIVPLCKDAHWLGLGCVLAAFTIGLPLSATHSSKSSEVGESLLKGKIYFQLRLGNGKFQFNETLTKIRVPM